MTRLNPLPTEEKVPAEDSQRFRNASRIAAIVLGSTLIMTVLLLFLAWQSRVWQMYALVGTVIVMDVLGFVGLRVVRGGRIRTGMLIVISGTVFALPFVPLLVSDLGLMMGSVIPIMAYIYASQSLQAKDTRRILLVGIPIGILVAATDFLNLAYRLQVPALQVVTPILVVSILLLITFFIAREVWGRSMRSKLLVALIGTTLLAGGALAVYVYTSTGNILRNGLESELNRHTDGIAVSVGNLLDAQINTLTTLSLNEALRSAVETQNHSYVGNADYIQATLNVKDEQWRAADAANNNEDSLVQQYLTNAVAQQLIEYQRTFPANAEVFVTDAYGGLAGTSNRTSDYYQADEGWWQAAYNNGQGAVYVSDPEFDESANALAVLMAMPLRNRETGEIVGILRTTYLASALNTILSEPVAETGKTDLFFPGEVVSNFHEGQYTQVAPGVYEALQAVANQGMVETNYEDTPSVVIQVPVQSSEGNQVVNDLGWVVVFHQQQDEAFAPINAQTRGAFFVMGIVLLLAVAAAFGLSQFLVRPITQLTRTAEEVAAGNLNSRAEVTSSDEISILASTFNNMTSRLQSVLQGLEERVAARTRNLELAAEVGRAVSQVRSLDVMLKDACELILKEFGLYYVQVYLTDSSQTNLVLEAGTGEVGVQLLKRGHSLPLTSRSINGRAAMEKHSMVISDTAQSATFLKNPLLPKTRGEMAVPLIVAGNVVGVLDMQSSEPGVLNDEVLPALEALAGQLAVAIQNAYLLTETEQARAQVEYQARRLVRESWSEHLDGIHKPEQLGFMFDHNDVTPLADVDESQLPENGHVVSAPISVTGESLGSLVVELDDEERAEQTSELVDIVARQVAQQIENLRLLESSERYRYEAEQAARLQTIEGWKEYMNSRATDHLGFMYNLKEVRPYHNEQDNTNALTLPVKARDERLGNLSIQGLTPDDKEEVELANAVVERLGAHIESLRLFEETKRGQVELDKRARQLAAVAEISNVSSKELDVQKMLESVVHLTQRQFGLYHAHVFIYNENTEELQIAACGWKEGDEHEGTHGTTAIPISKEQSLVARAARAGQAIIVNNVFTEPGWLPNPLLPDTASELAVPLVIGDRVLGVLDVQADHINAFTEEDANIQTTLAAQVATALQNARSFTQAQKQAEREAMLNIINQKIQSATSVEAVLQIAARELGTALGAPMTVAQLSMKDKSS